MFDLKTAAFIGGDLRTVYAVKEFAKLGYNVRLFGFDEYKNGILPEMCRGSIADAVNCAKTVVLPIPYSPDGVYLKAPFSRYKIAVSDLLQCIEKDQTAVGGCFDSAITSSFKKTGIAAVDCCERKDFKVLNAIPTAEGAIAAAINETDITLHGARCTVLSFGCVGEAVARLLCAAGASVTVAARSSADRAKICAAGMKATTFEELGKAVAESDLIFNAAPARVMDAKILACAKHGTLVIDLASSPGGVDEDFAKKAGVRLIKALSVPNKSAPVTAGLYLARTLDNIIKGVM